MEEQNEKAAKIAGNFGTAIVMIVGVGLLTEKTVPIQAKDNVTAFVDRMYQVCLDRAADEAGLDYRSAGENIEAGYYGASAVVDVWMNSADTEPIFWMGFMTILQPVM